MTERELDFARAEADVTTEEAALLEELKLLEQAALALHQRLKAARAQLADAERAGIKNEELSGTLMTAELPTFDLKAIRDRALSARAAALSAREDCNRQLRHGLQELKAELTALSERLVSDVPKVQLLASDARAANMGTLAKSAEAVAHDDEPLSGPAPVSKRAHERVRMQAAIDFGSAAGFSTNLSGGGLFIATAQPLPIGTELEVSFQLPGSVVIRARAVVRWIRGVTGVHTPGMGLQFIGLEEKDRAAIAAFIATREPLLFQDS